MAEEQKQAKEKKGFWKEFKEFIARGNVLDMAVGIIVGGAFTAIVNALCNNILKPIINWILAAIFGSDSLTGVFTFLRKVEVDGVVDLTQSIYIDWGTCINAVINFLLTALVLFLIIKAVMKVSRMRQQQRKRWKKLPKSAKRKRKPWQRTARRLPNRLRLHRRLPNHPKQRRSRPNKRNNKKSRHASAFFCCEAKCLAKFILFREDLSDGYALQMQEGAFLFDASRVARKAAVRADHAVTGNHDGDRIVPHGAADSLCRDRFSALRLQDPRDLSVCHGRTVGDLPQDLPYAVRKGRAFRVQGKVNGRIFFAEVTFQPCADLPEQGKVFFFARELRGEIFLSVKPKPRQGFAVACKRHAAKRRLPMRKIFHAVTPFRDYITGSGRCQNFIKNFAQGVDSTRNRCYI